MLHHLAKVTAKAIEDFTMHTNQVSKFYTRDVLKLIPLPCCQTGGFGVFSAPDGQGTECPVCPCQRVGGGLAFWPPPFGHPHLQLQPFLATSGSCSSVHRTSSWLSICSFLFGADFTAGMPNVSILKNVSFSQIIIPQNKCQ